MSSFLKLLKYAGLVVLGLLVAFAVIEIFVRTFYPQERNLFIADIQGKIRTIHKANVNTEKQSAEYTAQIKTNAQGFVGEDFTKQKPVGTYRIAVIGDSFTEGFQVDYNETYPFLLEQHLDENSDRDAFQVYNFGMSSSGTEMEFLMYKGYAREYRPDLVVLQYYVGNDVADDMLLHDSPSSSDAYSVPLGVLRGILSNWFHSPRFIVRRLEEVKAVRDVLTRYNITSRGKDEYTDPERYPFFFDLFNASDDTVFKEAFVANCEILKSFQSAVAADGTPLLVVVVPTRWQVYEEDWEGLLTEYPAMREESWDLKKPTDAVTACLKAFGISYLDLYPLLSEKTAAGQARMYYHIDNHWNELGHETVAGLIAETVDEIKNTH